jgi:ABC-type transport system, involved in lipoprotein release, permease component
VFVGFRTKEDLPSLQFSETFKKEMSRPLRIGNYYLNDVQSLVQMDLDTQYRSGMTNIIRIRIIFMIFLFVSISLCVLGTFRHRVNMRREEIGIRRSMGSNSFNIRKLFIVEGLLLLSIVVIPAMIIEMQFVHAGLIETLGQDINSHGDYLPDHIVSRFIITNAITWLLMAAMIIFAIWYPAYSASRMNPVDALRDE